MVRQGARIALLVVPLLLMSGLVSLADDGTIASPPDTLTWSTALAWLVPVGLGLVACGAVAPGRVATVIRVGWLALGIATLGYWLCGFAFQFGGVGFAVGHPDLAGLVREWSWAPLDDAWGTQWGVLGLEGYLLRGPASTPTALALFLAQLPWITTAVAIPLWSLQGRTKPSVLFLCSVLVVAIYALLGNWTWGGGWLANLGLNLELGHGFVDLSGASSVHLVGAACALAGMLAFGTRPARRQGSEQLSLPTMNVTELKHVIAEDGETYVPMPALHLPLLATLGAWLALIGTLGWVWSTPGQITLELQVPWVELGIRIALAAAGGAMSALAFGWLTTGEGNALLTARGVLGALVAAGSGLPFVPLWASVAIGAAAGIFVPLVQYLVEHVLRLDDPTSAIATHGIPAVWGVLAVGLFADGRVGHEWNQVTGGGVTGYWSLAEPRAGHWLGQLQAQAVGATAAFLTTFVLSWLLFAAVQSLTHAWQGEYTIRLPRRPRIRRPDTGGRVRRGPRIRFVTGPAQIDHLDAEHPERPDKAKSDAGRTWVLVARDRIAALWKGRRQTRVQDSDAEAGAAERPDRA